MFNVERISKLHVTWDFEDEDIIIRTVKLLKGVIETFEKCNCYTLEDFNGDTLSDEDIQKTISNLEILWKVREMY